MLIFSDIVARLSVRARKFIYKSGVQSLDDVSAALLVNDISPKYMRIKGIGPKTKRELRNFIRLHKRRRDVQDGVTHLPR